MSRMEPEKRKAYGTVARGGPETQREWMHFLAGDLQAESDDFQSQELQPEEGKDEV